MENMSICSCGEISQLMKLGEKQKDNQLIFKVSKINEKYFTRFLFGEVHEIYSCWSCGGLEVGDTTSETYLEKEFCQCKKIAYLAERKDCPINFNETERFFTLSYLDDIHFSSIILFCPFCSGKLFERKSDF
jgi:hypothetical protein